MQDFAPGLDHSFFFEAKEDSYLVEEIEGEVPAGLRGSFFVNGPARFERAGMRYRHWLDGDGMVHRLSFGDDGVRHTTRFVQSKKLRDEDSEGRFVYRAFGTSFEGDRLRQGIMLESPINVSVCPLGGRLLAFGEQSLPMELDPVTLETLGSFDFGGRLNEVSPVSAHPKIDPSTGCMVAFGVSFSSRPTLNLFAYDPARNGYGRRRHSLGAPCSIHDFNLLPDYAVFHLGPLTLNAERFVRHGKSVSESLDWRPWWGSRLLFIPRSLGEGGAFEVKVESKYCLHHISAFSRDGLLVVDLIEIDEPIYPHYAPLPDLFVEAPGARPVRYVVDPLAKTVVERTELDYDRVPDFPTVAATEMCSSYDRFWMLGMSAAGKSGRKFFDELVAVSWVAGSVTDRYQAPPGRLLAAQPGYAERPNGVGGPLIVIQEIDPEQGRAWYLMFDGDDLGAGPLTRLQLRHLIHPGFHSHFEPAGV